MKLMDWDDEEEKTGKTGKPEKNRSRKENLDFGDMDSGDMEFEEPAPEASQGLRKRTQEPKKRVQEDADSEELAPLPGWAKALIFTGLTVVAAIICAVLWHFVHPDKREEGNQGILAEANGSSEEISNKTQESDLNPASDAEDETDTVSESAEGDTSEPSAGSATDSAAKPTAKPAAGPEKEPESESASGTQSSESSEASETQPSSMPKPESGTQEPTAGNTGMTFLAVQESVTPKDAVNLRTAPNTADEGNIVTKIQNGETLARIGINNDTGWSQIDYNGQTLYAVSQYLTTDLNYKPPVTPTDPNRVTTAGGSVIIFENCDDWVTPKEYVNLRTEPSTVQEDATVSCQLNNGERAHRTGYSADFGWSRVEYNGQVLYVVTSFVYVVPVE